MKGAWSAFGVAVNSSSNWSTMSSVEVFADGDPNCSA